MKRLIRNAKGYNDINDPAEREKFVEENEQILKNNGWTEGGGIGLWTNDKYPVMIDDNSGIFCIFPHWNNPRYSEPMNYSDTAQESLNYITKNLKKITDEKARDENEGSSLEEAGKILKSKGWTDKGENGEFSYYKNDYEYCIYYSKQDNGFTFKWKFGKGYYDNDYPKKTKTIEEMLTWFDSSKDYFSDANRKKLQDRADANERSRSSYID